LLVIFSVRNVNIEFIKYSAEGSDENIMSIYNDSSLSFEKLKGSNILFIEDDDIEKHITNTDYLYLVSYEKVYPCTLDIVVKERVETFAIYGDDGYSIYDETGKLLRKSKDNINSSDNSPNLIVYADSSKMATVSSLCAYFKKDFSTLRNYVKSVQVTDSLIEKTSTFTFIMHSGLTIEIVDYETLAEEKIWAAFVEYSSLSEAEKLRGKITVVDRDGTEATIQTVYSA
jgi:hypothetical protein